MKPSINLKSDFRLLITLCLQVSFSQSDFISQRGASHLLIILILPRISSVIEVVETVVMSCNFCQSCLQFKGSSRGSRHTCHQFAAMPTRYEKSNAFSLWRVTAQKISIAKLLKKVQTPGSQCSRELRGGTHVKVEKSGSTYILFKWSPPRKYDTVRRTIQSFLKVKFHLVPVATDPPHTVAASASGVAESAAQVAASAATQVAVSAAQSACVASKWHPASLLALKLLDHINTSEYTHDKPSTAGLSIFRERFIKQGTFGQVFAAVYKDVETVAKVFGSVHTDPLVLKRQRPATLEERLDSARCEVAASAAFPPHKNILQLVDVSVWRGYPVLVYPRFDSSLHCLLKHRSLLEVERRHVMSSLLNAAAHLHAHGLVHADIKPGNVLVKGPGMRQPHWSDPVSCQQFGNDLFNLPHLLGVVLSDLGSIELGDPDQRAVIHQARRKPVVRTTLWYRAPELLLGASSWTFAIDAWSLGCLGVELVQGLPIFPARDTVHLLRMITTTFGGPKAGGGLSQLPLASLVPNSTIPTWPLKSVRSEHFLLEVLSGLLDIEPATRLTCSRAEDQVTASVAPHVVLEKVAMHRGPCSVTHGRLEDHVLQWLQADPFWSAFTIARAHHQKNSRCMAISEQEFKHEEGGYTGRNAPGCAMCNTMDMGHPLKARRVSAWIRCFLQLNRHWLSQLTKRVRAALRLLPQEELRGNGQHFFSTCFSDTALTYGVIQFMKAGHRYDPEHFDGGASLLHAGLTIFGTRHLELKVAESAADKVAESVADKVAETAADKVAESAADKWKVLPQSAGSFYIGNMCTAWHRVHHLDPEEAGVLCEAAGNVHIAIMLRTDVFREERARSMSTRPTPSAVFDTVNQVVASRLASHPLQFPDLGSCISELERQDGE